MKYNNVQHFNLPQIKQLATPPQFPGYIYACPSNNPSKWWIGLGQTLNHAKLEIYKSILVSVLSKSNLHGVIINGKDNFDAIENSKLLMLLNKLKYEFEKLDRVDFIKIQLNNYTTPLLEFLNRTGVSYDFYFTTEIYNAPFFIGTISLNGKTFYEGVVSTSPLSAINKLSYELLKIFYVYRYCNVEKSIVKLQSLSSPIDIMDEQYINKLHIPDFESVINSPIFDMKQPVELLKLDNDEKLYLIQELNKVNNNYSMQNQQEKIITIKKPIDLLFPDEYENKLSAMYHENSKILKISKVEDYIYSPHKISDEMYHSFKLGFKDYRNTCERYPLPDVSTRSMKKNLEDVITSRRSNHMSKSEPLSLIDLSHLLFYSYGITGNLKVKTKEFNIPLRAAPSGGGLYPIDLYLFARNVNGLKKGIYYYQSDQHELFLLKEVFNDECLDFIGIPNKTLKNSSTLLFFVANFRRNQWKYRERGYRIVHLDCGHLSQNILLNAENLNMVGKPCMGFADDYFNDFLEIDGINEAVLCLMTLSYKK